MENASALNAHLATRLRDLRTESGMTLDGLSERTGVSRSMISLIERGESSPTAAVLDKLAAGLGVTLASLFAEKDSNGASPLARRADQRVWRDPDSGYMRRNLSAAGFPSPSNSSRWFSRLARAWPTTRAIAPPRSISRSGSSRARSI
ncbi:helix-turn-helix domain-containing protein [Microvirga sp. RSM25]|uniref:helix-turn-helix domain-containing protein n=1 Tax=Microvirga sp. RSM25 TaxID=3273802 RepID=UPI00384B7400